MPDSVLMINACVRPASRTRQLAEQVLREIGGDVTEVNLEKEAIAPLNRERLERRDRVLAEGRLDDPMLRYALQLRDADQIVMAAPYWDGSFPSLLKIYMEAVTVCGVTFRYSEEGVPIGLCRAKRLIYVTTSGGPLVYDAAGYGYIRHLCTEFYGIKDVRLVKAEGLDIVGADVQAIMADAENQVKQILR